VGGGAPKRLTGNDEWSRTAPQWLSGGALVYAGAAPDGRSTIFLRAATGEERNLGADLVFGDRYAGVGRPLADRAGTSFAIEARRVRGPGSDLLLLGATGKELGVIGGPDAQGVPFWTRPLAWQNDGTLLYLSTSCASTVVQDYTLHARTGTDDKLLAAGMSLGEITFLAPVQGSLAYVVLRQQAPGERGIAVDGTQGQASLWLWDVVNGTRAELYNAPRAIQGLVR
jgi:hypothetical protein